ncbi:exodeoxyribonuclease VII small subunit [Paraglaciecola chathamensis]|jgi:exodeoxyribonuclease VII small subunit|uniref:Exodeoxyribonuclease 7 small subunit n=3 Tax=Paraglaciecola chathamensis TaxID=368405 RepID=A0A8H9M0F8_9ALTE|nr:MULTISPECIES: exodeoxyribonuclease VII small subunit [Paraglaciecola]AEE24013.1 exodeoxyribonuclease VII, small subunit [Glaciecola sp. 4H-3-7+YE-5]MBN25420.1 exodeoxyribonuclease VII small subunit [Alteromonadaceae bacterium]MBJ2134844.1 exodeoxyribonuclease VII small subunit [Paraglaciecola chathamensis]MDO6558410.1 exodeoxyribonuclease VII small subunit [Paraglaciecola chathamensis]MDO6840447.1 exodeoxyribonuclease VII small subunit [Paraglaciecola chathamensis]|tara:strand:+ start:15297 stop:15548 length:252 start_codon:yes stop_codon:yes gene_type:complete
MTSRKKTENLSFEESMQELDSIVNQMEEGELSLEDALSRFERGVQLARHSQNKLKQAEQKVQILMGQDEQAPLADFDPANTQD